MSHWERLLPGKILRVSLEELIAQQEATSRRLLSFCGLKWDAAVVNFHKTKRDVRTASQSQVSYSSQRRSHLSSVCPCMRAATVFNQIGSVLCPFCFLLSDST